MRNLLLLGVLVLLVALLVGCGGSGSTPKPAQSGALSGKITAAGAQDYAIYVDGAKVAAVPTASGAFSIPHLPPGPHTLSFIAPTGMTGAYVDATVTSGDTVDVGDVTPVVGGQITGLVMKEDGAGGLTPLAGVEVIADPEIWYALSGGGSSTGGGTAQPLQSTEPVPGENVKYKAVTNDDGSYTIPAVAPGPYMVTVNLPGLEQGQQFVSVPSGGTASADFHLKAVVAPGVGTIEGTVLGKTDSGNIPLEGAVVTVLISGRWLPPTPIQPLPMPVKGLQAVSGVPPDAIGIMPPPYFFNEFSTLTDASGKYSLNVPSGHATVQVWAEGYVWSSQTVTVQPDATLPLDFLLEPWTIQPLPPIGPLTGDPTTGKP